MMKKALVLFLIGSLLAVGYAQNDTVKKAEKPQKEQKEYKPLVVRDRLVFDIGMVELVSYWKSACPPTPGGPSPGRA